MYCKNCGSILQQNANFCHVCGAKVEIDDIFDAPKNEEKEEKVEEKVPFATFPNEEYKKEEKKPVYETRDSFYDYTPSEEDENAMQVNALRRKAFISGLISMIGSLFFSFDALLSYFSGVLVNNFSLERGNITYDDYVIEVKNLLVSVGVYLFLAATLGLTLGIIGVRLARKARSVKGMIFGISGIVVGGFAALFIILVVLYYTWLGA